MKKIIVLLIVGLSSLSAFSQKEAVKPVFTFAGKSGDCTMTWEEFKTSKKELLPIEKNVAIISFNVTVQVTALDGKEAVYVDYPNQGNTFSKETSDAMDKLIAEKRIAGNKILIEEVKASKDGGAKERVYGMVITLK